jgi:DNA-binding FadR family transcriptional regulator
VAETIGRPIYQQVADDLRSQIASGKLPVGSPIPSTARLMKIYKASNSVIRAAVAQLQNDGILYGQPGKGVYVETTPEIAAEQAVSIGGLAEQVGAFKEKLSELAERAAGSGFQRDVDELNRRFDELNRRTDDMQALVGVLHTRVIELYGRQGYPYPHELDPPIEGLEAPERRRSL